VNDPAANLMWVAIATVGVLMIKKLDDLPAGVVGFEVEGRLRAEDYRDVILPEVDAAARSGEVRFVIVMPQFHGLTAGALWQDVTIGVKHLRAWKRIAVITDIDWVHHATSLFGWMTPGQVRVYALKDREQAIGWAAAD
jgi:SpoIIAA-like